MKRALEPAAGEAGPGPSSTPSHKHAAKLLKSSGKTVLKRPRCASIRAWASTTKDQETPATFLTKQRSAARDVWPTSAQRKFECLGMYTPVEGLPTDKGCSSAFRAPPSSAKRCCPPTAGDDVCDDEGFVLFSQSDYVRGSQAVGTPVATPDVQQSDDTQVASMSFFAFHSQASLHDDVVPINHLSQPFAEPSTHLSTQPTVSSQHLPDTLHCAEDDHPQEPLSFGKGLALYTCANDIVADLADEYLSQPPAMGPLDTHAVTPELGGYMVTSTTKAEEPAPPSASGMPGVPRMFNIFLPRTAQRHLVIIRHGESEFNRAVVDTKDFKDPMIFDPHLTCRGIEQARALRSKLQQQLSVHGQALWVVSPLRRAMETFLEACPMLERGHTPLSAPTGFRAPHSLVPAGQQSPVSVEVLPTISEFVATAGDVGTPASELSKEFPLLEGQLCQIPDRWWYQGNKKPNCAQQKAFHQSEPRDHRKKRVAELARWLSSRPERFIIMIGHASFWHEFRGRTEKHMSNGEMRCMSW